MPELKRNFSQGKMNKDLDERLVPPGEYRDANNIQISTSDGSDVGAVQTMLGNTKFIDSTKLPAGCTCVGAVVSGKNDKLYWFIKGPSPLGTAALKYDFILEVNIEHGIVKYVVVDNYQTDLIISAASDDAATLTFTDSAGVRTGMYALFTDSTTLEPQKWEVLSIDTSTANAHVVTLAPLNGVAISVDTAVGTIVKFIAPRVLNFSGKIITAINVVEDNLFWTDNESEPKKVNITRSILGTGGVVTLNTIPSATFVGDNYNYHTRLVATFDDALGPEVVTNAAATKAVFLAEEHVTVIRKNPVTPLYLEMSSTEVKRTNSNGDVNSVRTSILSTKFTDANGQPLEAGVVKSVFFTTGVDYRIDDVLIFKSQSEQSTPNDFTDYIARAVVISVPIGHQPPDTILPGISTNTYELSINSVSDNALNTNEAFSVALEQKKPLFEFKFPRFSYRYKYVDGEYSTFAPWSQVAFLPGNFDYLTKQGYNLAMTNRLRSLVLKNYIVEDSLRPRDVVEVDILYKESSSPVCYTVKTIKPKDGDANPVMWPNTSTSPYARGEFQIDSEMIHAVIPSNQLLRPWDNVPRLALAQEITGNRLVYANYLQNYDLVSKGMLVRPQLDVNLISTDNSDYLSDKSIKSMRTYQLGIVYSDQYGRETPVLTDQQTGSLTVNKEDAVNFNKIQVKINSNAPEWAKTYKFYIKETSNEYYNLAMDRWYDALDGNVWISFPSAERNKVDEETFLIIKKQHDNLLAVEDENRYKIIAIENDAPEFIKKKKTSLGILNNSTHAGISNNVIGDSGGGFPFVDTNSFTLITNQAEDIFGEEFYKEEKLEVRIKSSGGDSSLTYEVLKAGLIGNNEVLITIKKKFGNDLLFATTDDPQTYANRISTLQVEFFKVEIENKPEFDGRFFVKLYKDLLLQKNILGVADSDDLVIVQSASVRYINTLQESISNIGVGAAGIIPTSAIGNGSDSNIIWTATNSYSGSSVANYSWAPTFGAANNVLFFQTSGENGGFGSARNFWEGFSSTHKNHDKGNWFIDQAAVRPDVYTIKSSGVSAYAGLAGCGNNIDHNNGIGEVDSGGAVEFLHPTAGNLVLEIGKTMDDSGLNVSDSVHGKGIHAKNCAIDIAFSGLWPYGADAGKDGIINRLQDAVASKPQYEQDVAFANDLFNVGARFRFKNDPDKIVYTVLFVRELYGLRNYKPQNKSDQTDNCSDKNKNDGPNYAANKRHRWTLVVDQPFGEGPSKFWPLDMKHDGMQGSTIEVLQAYNEDGSKFSENPAIFETEPKEDVGLDIYYEASQAYPMDIDFRTNEQLIPVGSIVQHLVAGVWTTVSTATNPIVVRTYSVSDQKVTLDSASVAIAINVKIRFTQPDGSVVHAYTAAAVSDGDTTIILHGDGENTVKDYRPHNVEVILPWHNCYSFGNGVESDRIRDDYNQVRIGKGVKASTVLAEQFREERRSSGLIFSGIYNTNSGVNRLNQFIQAEAITKDLNPSYGSIQKLYSRDTDLITLCEDKILKIVSNKDALFNADGNPQLIATNRVLGQATPYVGDFGISTNPESFVTENYRMYFTDRQRGAVLRLSRDGLTPISEAGMKDWFKTNFGQVFVDQAIGSYDKDKSCYNITLKTITKRGADTETRVNYTLSYKESVKGWQSFHSFVPEFGISANNKYFTFKDGFPWQHHVNDVANNYYGVQYYSDVTAIINDMPGAVKSFATINYEGTQSRVLKDLTDENYYNLAVKEGWYLESFTTDQQTGSISEFLNKEGKWFNYLKGDTTVLNNLDGLEFSVQGIGNPSSVSHDGNSDDSGGSFKLYVQDSSQGTNGDEWDEGNTYT